MPRGRFQDVLAHADPGAFAEDVAVETLYELFAEAYSKVVVLRNLVFPTAATAAVRSTEVDAVVVCPAGVWVFEVKGWSACRIERFKREDGGRQWMRLPQAGPSRPSGPGHEVRDPMQQVGGKLKLLQSLLGAIEPVVRLRAYVLLPLEGVQLGIGVPPQVLTAAELPLLVRQTLQAAKKATTTPSLLSDAQITAVVLALESAGRQISRAAHLQNIRAVHGHGSEWNGGTMGHGPWAIGARAGF